VIEEHFAALEDAAAQAKKTARTLQIWADHLALVLDGGGRLLTCGHGGSAAVAQLFSGAIAGRFLVNRRPYGAIPLHADTSAMTAVLNDYGHQELFSRGVRAHGRAGDVLVALVTDGGSQSVVDAAKTARETGMTTWAMTGPGPNNLATVCHDVVAIEAPNAATVQEIHLAAIHALCGVFDELVDSEPGRHA
jgi:D-sedoheptulose 7-phosphate isomerase